VRTAPNQGATFRIALPLAPEAHGGAAADDDPDLDEAGDEAGSTVPEAGSAAAESTLPQAESTLPKAESTVPEAEGTGRHAPGPFGS
jgi:hypothetical protein